MYRIRQFWQGFTATVSEEEYRTVSQILSADELRLFQLMPVDAQRHSLEVLKQARLTDEHNSDLEVAALLHDVGKCLAGDGVTGIGLWMRGPIVLSKALMPGVLQRIASPERNVGIRYTAYVQLEHAHLGADLAAQAGSSDTACWLIRHHEDEPIRDQPDDLRHQLLQRLQIADSSA